MLINFDICGFECSIVWATKLDYVKVHYFRSTILRPRLEYAVQAWRPYLQKDIDLIEGVQRRATKLVVETKGMSYDERLKFLDMTTLETRRVSIYLSIAIILCSIASTKLNQ
jgi:hypothetical protein